MSDGGGFCELHGPFDPPYTTCPYCQLEQDQRQVFGPPEPTRPHTAQPDDLPENTAPNAGVEAVPEDDDQPDVSLDIEADDGDFVRRTVEPDARRSTGDVTEIAPRADAVDDVLEPDDAPPPLGWLIVKEPLERRGIALPVRPNQTIGREGDVQWDDPRLSRQHARLTFEAVAGSDDPEARFHLWPFGPTNPVYVNGEAIRGATPLHENDTITLGTTVFVFKVLLD